MARYYYLAPMRSPLKRSKVNTKHDEILLKNDEEDAYKKEYYNNTFLFGSVRNKGLQKLLLVDYMIKNSSWVRRELVERYKDHNRDNPQLLVRKFGYSGTEDNNNNLGPCELMHYLGPADIMKILGCNRRTAAEYKHALDRIHSIYESMCLCG
jgi:hypothetical protein